MKCPIINPIKFYDSTAMPNWSTRYPNPDNTTQRTEYISGLSPVSYYKEYLVDQTIYLQFAKEVGDATTLTVKKYNESTYAYETNTTVTPTDITPSGWVGDTMLSYSLSLSVGTYYLTFDDGFRSDTFAVISDSELVKRLVKVTYTHAENDYGCIFDNSYTFTNYFQGQFMPAASENEIEAFETDRGEHIKLQATPKRVFMLNINDIHINYIDHVNMLFSLDTLTVNGMEVENIEAPQVELVEFTDLCNITVKLYLVDNDYYYL